MEVEQIHKCKEIQLMNYNLNTRSSVSFNNGIKIKCPKHKKKNFQNGQILVDSDRNCMASNDGNIKLLEAGGWT